MIPIEKLKRVTVVYTHAHCPDGLASAMILKDAFRMLGTAPRIEFLAHGTPEHIAASNGDQEGFALWCDIAPSASGLMGMTPGELLFIVLDHHVGAQAIVESFGENGVYADAEKEPGVSGAVLAWREVWDASFLEMHGDNDGRHGTPIGDNWRQVRDFALSVGARDTWHISKMLMSKPASYWLSNRIAYLTEGEIANGRTLFVAHEEAVRQAVEQCVLSDICGHTLAVFQEQASGFRLCSDVAEALRNREYRLQDPVEVVAGFAYVVDKPGGPPRLLYSLRGLNGFDVCAFAQANDGGGHKAAAGFSIDIRAHCGITMTDPYEEIRRRLETFLITGAGTSS